MSSVQVPLFANEKSHPVSSKPKTIALLKATETLAIKVPGPIVTVDINTPPIDCFRVFIISFFNIVCKLSCNYLVM